MKIIYVTCDHSEIVLFEGPPGSRIYWGDGFPVPWPHDRKALPAVWRVLETKRDALKPRTRVLAVASEVQDTPARICQAIKKAHGKLPKSCQSRGILGVTLKGEPYEAEGKRWRCVGFFYIPSAKAWAGLYDEGIVDAYDKAPEGLPSEIRK